MPQPISRRSFFTRSAGFGAGLWFLKRTTAASASVMDGPSPVRPLIVTDHANETGKQALETGWSILSSGGSALDAIEKAVNVIEVDPEDTSVGYGGLPNEDGVVQLDASIMDGKTYSAGAVGCLENIKTPSSVARCVMEKSDHVFLVGEGALGFAKMWGFKEENLLTDKARNMWIQWKTNLNDTDDWGPPDHVRTAKPLGAGPSEIRYGTTNVLAVDSRGDIAGVTSTSGLSYKIPGRVGDSPIIGAGLYVDNEVGAAGATGRGEDVIKSCASFFILLRMKEGRTPQQACEDALQMIVDKYKKVNPQFFPGEKFVAVNKAGVVGCSAMGPNPARMAVRDSAGYRLVDGSALLKK
jgi:N4-(beta-N-acetylglucosaminyl)-L-asparaginase